MPNIVAKPGKHLHTSFYSGFDLVTAPGAYESGLIPVFGEHSIGNLFHSNMQFADRFEHGNTFIIDSWHARTNVVPTQPHHWAAFIHACIISLMVDDQQIADIPLATLLEGTQRCEGAILPGKRFRVSAFIINPAHEALLEGGLIVPPLAAMVWVHLNGTLTGPDVPERPYDGLLCDETCIACGHKHVHDESGRCMTGDLPSKEFPLIGRCPCPYPHGVTSFGPL